jgi:Rieske 2Fe-2S family protein
MPLVTVGVQWDDLVARHRRGFALDREFTTDPGVYRLDIDRIWRRSWLFACHGAEVREPGDFVVVDVDDDSVVVLRAGAGRLRAWHNVCRHRGTRLCSTSGGVGGGHASRLVCPYHQWTYSLDGTLEACGGMDETGEIADRSAYGLLPVAVEEAGGLVFINLASDPASFDSAQAELEAALRPQGLAGARVAAVRDYEVAANWKLVWENNRECWHCAVNHPQYARANHDDLAALYPFPSGGHWWSANRAPLTDGWVTESLDGAPVAPLMGDRRPTDADTVRARTLPNFWNHSSRDHSVSTRLLPAGPGLTRIRVTWLVTAASVEGQDYQLEALLPFWALTSEQDWELCERNQAGVRSQAFIPGPYSRRREANVIAFMDWYLDRMAEVV